MWTLWTWGMAVSVLIALAGAALTLWSRRRTRQLLTTGARAEGVVVVADPRTMALMHDGMREYRSRVKVSYPVNGTPVEQWLVLDDEEYETGDRVTVFHDPRHPSRVRTESSPNRDFLNALGLLTGFSGGALLFVLLVVALLRLVASPAY